MFNWFDVAMAQRVDDLTRRFGERTRAYGELKQLSKLFGQGYLRALHWEMTGGLIARGGPGAILQIKLAWIDKIPLAKPTTKTKKTELGDAVLFAIEEHRIAGQPHPISRRARAVLLQAKVTQRYGQIKKPTVPISPMRGSTKNEFELLSGWPEFDLYKTSGNKTALATAINLNAAGVTPRPFGWYLGAPRSNQIPSNVAATWPSWWMLGPPIQNDDCDVSFGTFLRSFLNGLPIQTSNGPLEAGEAFNCPSYPPPKANFTGWDRICAEIIDIVEDVNLQAPQSIFGASTSRMASMDEIYLNFIAPTPIRAYFWSYPPLLRQHPHFPPHLFAGWQAGRLGRRARHHHRRIPVLIFRTAVYEGEG